MPSFTDLFTEDERQLIDQCVESGAYDNIPSALGGLNSYDLTPEKEKALQEYLNEKRPIVDTGESDVRNELRQKELEGFKIETPEQEAEWQARINEENAAKKAAQIGETQETSESVAESSTETPVETPVESIPADDLSEIELTKAEIMAELTKKGIAFKPAQSKAELSNLLSDALAKS